MRNVLWLAVIALTVSACQKEEAKGNLHITGNVEGLKKGTLYIQKVVDTSLVAVDTIKIDGDSHFKADFTIDSPEMYYLFLDRGVTNSLDNNLPFFVEPGNIDIQTQLDHFLSGAKITGSKNHEQYEEFKKIRARYTDRNLTLMEEKLNAFKDARPGVQDSLQKLQDDNLKRQYLATANFAVTHKDFEIAPYLALAEIPDINLKFLDTIYKSMSPKVAKSFYGKKLTEYRNARTKENR